MVKYRTKAICTLPILILGLMACGAFPYRGSNPQPVEISLGQVLFDCYYVNFAWGYTLSGYFINQDGMIVRYDRGKDPWLPESIQEEPGVVSTTDLNEKFKNQEQVGTVDPTILAQKIELVYAAAVGIITQEQMAADAGWSGCVLYRYHPELDGYSEIPLGAGGDFLVRNSAPEAQELLRWLQDLNTAQ
jgi:hypothetical protein